MHVCRDPYSSEKLHAMKFLMGFLSDDLMIAMCAIGRQFFHSLTKQLTHQEMKCLGNEGT